MTLKEARDKRKWTQAELSRRSGVAQARISYIENGITADPLDSTVRALEKALGVKRGTLVFGREALAS